MAFKSGYQALFDPSRSVAIAQGETDSEFLACNGFVPVGIILPSLFTGTALSFLVGDDVDGYQANGEISFTGPTTDGDTLHINSVAITFVTASPSGNEVLIGASDAETASNLYSFLVASSVAGLLACGYSLQDTIVTVKALVHGTDGNAYTFTKSSTDITLSPSGGTLSGGGFRPLYDMANSAVSMTVGAGRCYAIDPKNFQGVQFLKIRSGSTEVAARTLIVSLKGF